MADTFKDDLRTDIQDTFFNLDEFSELTWVDGVLMRCQITSYTAGKSDRQNETYAGLHGDFIKVYFDADVYCKKHERLPRQGEWILIGDRRYDVVSSKNEMGVAQIVCSAYRQNTLRQRPFGDVDPYNV